ncbi:MAG: 4-(cytidine 5'-diphospho)-2-C-methyl-D-erythritol kinase [Lachnospiraceae bacterium]|nr:4-(cytidine 5'-diphospho)-2-C-methyl-D-erythritol kinase [Lachnospiraceae bacterium]
MIKISAYAKINLTLDVTGKLPNGYHELRSVMQQTDLHDDVIIDEGSDKRIILEVMSESEKNSDNVAGALCHDMVPTDGRNIAYRAAEKILDAAKQCGKPCGNVKISLVKRIPAAAGMAGGSTDAAAVLTGINRFYELGFTEEKLCEIGVTLGADVPFCIKGGTALCEGIGEKMTALPSPKGIPVLIAKPAIAVSTAEAYSLLDEADAEGKLVHPDTDGLVSLLKAGGADGTISATKISGYLGNGFYQVIGNLHPEIRDLCNEMTERGAAGSLMSGSGPSVFGLFEDKSLADKVRKEMEVKYPGVFFYSGYLI